MSVLPILTWPDKRLQTKCSNINAYDADLSTFATDLLDTMYAANGRGLAAPQVGVLTRMFVMDAGWKTGPKTPLVCINPTFTAIGSKTQIGDEQCLSIPNRALPIARHTQIQLRWFDLRGQAKSATLSGESAIIAQHETDHLDGTLILDRIGDTT